MGNLPSHVVDEDRGESELEKAAAGKEEAGEEEDNLLDFGVLYQPECLHKALVRVSDAPMSELQKKSSDIETWLNRLVDRDEMTVSFGHFVDHLGNKGVPREQAEQFFHDVDTDGEGVLEVPLLLSMLKDSKGPDLAEALVSCHTLPGAMDVYVTDKSLVSADLGIDLVKFLRRHRVAAHKLLPIVVNQLIAVYQMREKLIHGRYHMCKDRMENDLPIGGGGAVGGAAREEEGGMEKVVITKCYSEISVSTNQRLAGSLTDGQTDTYWQSNGSPRSHWIRIHLLPGVKLKDLAIGVDTNDDSYMPRLVIILAGNSPATLKEIRQVNVPREQEGRFLLMNGLNRTFKYIQLNIKGCHSDGCDTRIRQLYIRGYRYKQEPEPTVLDTLASWYLSLISSLVKSVLPQTPMLRDTILQQSKAAMQRLPPLSISPSSMARPEFLTPYLVQEMSQFMSSVCLPRDNFVSVDEESLSLLLHFSLATGDVNSILDCLQILLDNLTLQLSVTPLMNKLMEIVATKHRSHSHVFKMKVARSSCAGEESHLVANMLSNNMSGSGNAFKSIKGRKTVNVLLRDQDDQFLQPSKIIVKVPKNDTAARAGLLFLLDSDDLSKEELSNWHSEFDTWTMSDWEQWCEGERGDGDPPAVNLLTYFEPEKETGEVEVVLKGQKAGKVFLLKLLSSEPPEDSKPQISVHCVQLRGHRIGQEQWKLRQMLSGISDPTSLPTDPTDLVEGRAVLVRVLWFLSRMMHDLTITRQRRQAANLDPDELMESHLATEGLSLEKIWNLYIPLTLSSEAQLNDEGALLCLLLLLSSLPYLKITKDVPSAVLSHLCSLMDNSSTDPVLRHLAQEIIREGVVIFFPGASARKEYLLEMVKVVLVGKQPASWWLKFEALCRYFSKIDSNALLGLPWKRNKTDTLDKEQVMRILTTILSVATSEAEGVVKEGSSSQPQYLVRLLCTLQSSLFFWCRQRLEEKDEDKEEGEKEGEEERMKEREEIIELLTEYIGTLVSSCLSVLKQLKESMDTKVLESLQETVIGSALAEMLSHISSFTSEEALGSPLLGILQPLLECIQSLSSSFPSLFPALKDDKLRCDGESVLSVWTRESQHNYENNTRFSEEFVCPGADRFTVEFDSRCKTERRYDYIHFIDSAGVKHTFDDNYGSDRWPTTAEFQGNKLHFKFYSDGSNNYWGYKFTLKAHGKSLPKVHWLFDLHLSLCRVLGQICSNIISSKTVKVLKVEERKEEELLLNSNLWKTLFRGGYNLVGKLTRTLSGIHSTADSELSGYLQSLVDEDSLPQLMQTCRDAKGGHYFGGQLVDKAITATFAALVWHSQEIREELVNNLEDPKVTPGVFDAFTAAEGLRGELVEARQKLKETKVSEEEDKDKHSAINQDEPVQACHSKAVFLLKFAGLSRIKGEALERPNSPVVQRPSYSQQSKRWRKISAVVGTVGRLKHHQANGLSIRHPSFELVLSFIRNSGVSVDRVHSLLQQRAALARRVVSGYSTASNVTAIMTSSGASDVPLLMFLHNMLSKQRQFPLHYVVRMDGCGLELENQLRRSFQNFLYRLKDCISSQHRIASPEPNRGELVVRNIFCHLLDMSWQDYDYLLLRELRLPDFLFESSISASIVEEVVDVELFDDEEELMKNYEAFAKLREFWDSLSNLRKYHESEIALKDEKMAHLFACGMATPKSRVVQVNCDRCTTVVRGPWYHNLDQESYDLCTKCYSEEGSTDDDDSDSSDDKLYILMGNYTCNECKMWITSHRFVSETRSNFNLCLGCFRKEEKEKSVKDSWTVFYLKKITDRYPHRQFMSHDESHSTGFKYKDGVMTKLTGAAEPLFYNQQHSWGLFSSLALSMAQRLAQNRPGSDSVYLRYACQLLVNCLELVVKGLQFTLQAAKEDAQDKARRAKLEEEKKAAKEKPVVVLDENDNETESKPASAAGEKVEGENKEQKEDKEQKEKKEVEDKKEKKEVEDKKEKKEVEDKKEKKEVEDKKEKKEVEDKKEKKEVEDKKEKKEVEDKKEKKEVEDKEQRKEEEGAKTVTEEETKSEQKDKDQTDAPKDVSTEQPLLETVSTSSGELKTESVATPSCDETTPVSETERLRNAEKTFGMLYGEKSMGLLSAILPRELTLQNWINQNGDVERVLAEQLLPVLLQLTESSAVEEKRRMQSLLLTAQYMARVSPEVADHAIEVLSGDKLVPGAARERTNGIKTVTYLLDQGAEHLKCSNYAGTATVAECLLLLAKGTEWRPAISKSMGECLDNLPQSQDLSGMFGLLVTAGFPRLARVGSLVVQSGESDEDRRGVILSPPANTGTAQAMDLKTRKPWAVSLSSVEVEDTLRGCATPHKLSQILTLINTSLPLIKQESPHQVEAQWMLALAIKALGVVLSSWQYDKDGPIIDKLLKRSMLASIVKISGKPTQFSRSWLLGDLEVLGISCYRPEKEKDKEQDKEQKEDNEEKKEDVTKEEEKEVKEKEEEEVKQKETKKEEEHDNEEDVVSLVIRRHEREMEKDMEKEREKEFALKGLEDDMKEMISIMSEAFQCKLSILRALFESVERNTEKFIMSSEQHYDDGALKPPAEILEASKQWELVGSVETKSITQQYEDCMEDTGVTRLTPMAVDFKSMEAKAESQQQLEKSMVLIQDTKKKNKTEEVSAHKQSFELLQKELASLKEKQADRQFMSKVNTALIVLHSRQVLCQLLTLCDREKQKISTTMLGGIDLPHYFSLLDLLTQGQHEQQREKLLSSVLRCGEPTEVVSLALTAAQCMREVIVATETKQFKNPSVEKYTETGKVCIPGASSLKVSFDHNPCAIFGSVELATDADFCINNFSKSAKGGEDKWAQYVLPGNTLYYKITVETQENPKHNTWSLQVKGTQSGRFETSYSILRILLCKSQSSVLPALPLPKLWSSIIAAACDLVGEERLKIISLLLQLLHINNTAKPSLGASAEAGAVVKLDLTLLRPMWHLYTSLTKDKENEKKTPSLKPEIVRALTELFLVVENLAKEWGVEQNMMVESLTDDALNSWLREGISNVAFVSIDLGISNTVSDAFIEAKRNYIPKPPTPPAVPGEGSSSSSSSSSSDSSDDEDSDDDDDDDDDDDEDSFDSDSDY